MIFSGTFLKVADNSGVKIVKCLQTIGKPYAVEGDFIIVSVRRSRSGKRVPKGKIYKAVVVQCRKSSSRLGGQIVSFRSNRVVLLRKTETRKKDVVPLGTRVYKTVSFSLKKRNYAKILLLSPGYL